MNKQDELAALSNLTADRTIRDQTLGGIIAKAAALVAADAQVGAEFIPRNSCAGLESRLFLKHEVQIEYVESQTKARSNPRTA